MKPPEIPVHHYGEAEAAGGMQRLAPCYVASRTAHGCSVVVMPRGLTLPPRLDVWTHSPVGYEWGYEGSGPAQLALALLLDVMPDEPEEAVRLHQTFKWHVVSRIAMDDWLIWREDIEAWVEQAQGDPY